VENLPLFKKIVEITQFGRGVKSQLERKRAGTNDTG
jgi:hypothetical protein